MNIHLTDIEIQQMAEGMQEMEKHTENHLATCASCGAKYRIYQSLYKAIRVEPAPEIPYGFADKVVAVATKKQEQKIIQSYQRLYLAAIAVFLIVVIAGLSDYRIRNLFNEFHAGLSGHISLFESVLIMSAIGFIYIVVSGFKKRSPEKNSLSDIIL